MKQVLQDRSGRTVVRDVPAPQCGAGSLLVRNAFSVISSGTERSRVATSQKSLLGKALERPDLVREVIERARLEGVGQTHETVKRRLSEETPVGYSCAGQVMEVGEAVRSFIPGQWVACAGGGHANHAEIVNVPANLCARIPDGVPLESAAMTTIAAIALHGVRLAETRVGDRVAVVACGLIGQIACRLLRAAGAEVFALDVDPRRVDEARAAGAEHGFVVGPETAEAVVAASNGIGMDEVLVTAAASSNDPLELGAAVARDRGTIVLIGDVPVEMSRKALYEKELSFRVSRSYGPGRYDLNYEERGLDYPIGYVRWTEQRNMECILDLQARGLLRLEDLVEIVSVADAREAYERLVGPPEQRPRRAIALSYGDETDEVAAPELHAPSVASWTSVDGATHSQVREPVRIGLIGPGRFALRVLAPAISSAGGVLEVAGGGSGPSAEAAARTAGFARIAENEAAVIADERVDATVIATRHGSHARLTIQALRAGKHVFCEKPLALSSQELEEVLAAARESPGILAVGFNRRFSPLLREVRAFVSGGASVPVTATYRVSAGEVPSDHWVHDLEQGGGRALGEGCHFVDALTFVVGAPISTVYAIGYGYPDAPLQARDNLSISLSFADGSSGTVVYVADGSVRLPKERLEVFSGERTAVLDDYVKLKLYYAARSKRRRLRSQEKGHAEELRAFVHGVRTGQAPVPLTEIANVSLATLAIVESLRTGQPVRIETSDAAARAGSPAT